MARIIDCPCGHTLIGEDDNELFRLAREHVDRDHQEMERTDEQLWERVRADARDAASDDIRARVSADARDE